MTVVIRVSTRWPICTPCDIRYLIANAVVPVLLDIVALLLLVQSNSLKTSRDTHYTIYLIYCTLGKPTGKISDQSMMIL